MSLAHQRLALLQVAAQLAGLLPADAVLLLTETDLDWPLVRAQLGDCRLLVAAQSDELIDKLQDRTDLTAIEIDPGPALTQERISQALLTAVREESLRHGADVVVLYNGIEAKRDAEEPF